MVENSGKMKIGLRIITLPLSLWLMIQVIFSVAILVQLRLRVTKLVLQHVPDWFP